MTAQRDLHVLAARMCLEDVEGGDHPRRGFVVVYVRRGQGGTFLEAVKLVDGSPAIEVCA